VTDDFLRNAEAALQVRHLRRVKLDLADDVVALEVPVDRVRQAAPSPEVHIDDLANTAGYALVEALQAVTDDIVADLRAKDHNQFVVT
jgi:hypothetical protein